MKIPVLLMARELHIGGSERQMTETAKSLDRSVFEAHVGCFRPAGLRGDELREAGVPVVQFPVNSFGSPAAIAEARALARYIREKNIQIVHAWDYQLNVYAIPVTRLLTNAVAIGSQRSHRELIPGVYRRLTRLSDRLAHAVVVNCEYLRRHLIEEENIPAKKVQVCYNGIDLDRFRRQMVAPHPLTIGTICGLRPEKDLSTLLAAFAAIDCPRAQLVFVGSGDELPRLRREAGELGIDGRCHFEPATAQVTEWLSKIDIFVIPSRSEALSNSLMEAMACGCCVVASEVGGNTELVRHDETGLLFRSGDREALTAILQRLAASPEERRGLAAKGEAFIREKFSTAAAAKRMGTIYDTLIAGTQHIERLAPQRTN